MSAGAPDVNTRTSAAADGFTASPAVAARAATRMQLRNRRVMRCVAAPRSPSATLLKRYPTQALSDFGRPHHHHHAGGLLLVLWLQRLIAQILEIVGKIVDLGRVRALAHVDADIQLRQLGQRGT